MSAECVTNDLAPYKSQWAPTTAAELTAYIEGLFDCCEGPARAFYTHSNCPRPDRRDFADDVAYADAQSQWFRGCKTEHYKVYRYACGREDEAKILSQVAGEFKALADMFSPRPKLVWRRRIQLDSDTRYVGAICHQGDVEDGYVVLPEGAVLGDNGIYYLRAEAGDIRRLSMRFTMEGIPEPYMYLTGAGEAEAPRMLTYVN